MSNAVVEWCRCLLKQQRMLLTAYSAHAACILATLTLQLRLYFLPDC